MISASCAAERWARRMGYRRIAGTDEAGRGALAGPLVAAAVMLPPEEEIEDLEGITDSKLLNPAARRTLFRLIKERALGWSFACIPPHHIDVSGLQANNLSAMSEAVLSLSPRPDMLLTDFYHLPEIDISQWNIVHGDRRSRSIAAASILAKVIRDQLMWFWSIRYPEYGFEKNKGYGTEYHLKALLKHGPSPCHRRSFRSVIQMELELE